MMGELPVNASSQPAAWYQNVLNTAAQAATQYLTLKQQQELLKIQTRRLEQGLPPLDVSQYTPGVSVGIAQSTQTTLLWAFGVGAAVYLLGKVLK